MSIFSSSNKNKPEESNSQGRDVEYAMNDHCENARKRTGIFTKFVNSKNYFLLPGRYGGEYNNDMIALDLSGERTTLLLGIKVSGSDGGIQLDQMSMGPFVQFTDEWINMVILSLRLKGDCDELASVLEAALHNKTLSTVVLFIDLNTQQLSALPISFD